VRATATRASINCKTSARHSGDTTLLQLTEEDTLKKDRYGKYGLATRDGQPALFNSFCTSKQLFCYTPRIRHMVMQTTKRYNKNAPLVLLARSNERLYTSLVFVKTTEYVVGVEE
jgi:hypothetical protein